MLSPINLTKIETLFFEQSQLAIAMIRQDQVKYYGFIRRGKDFVTFDNRQAVFEISSITKVFTAQVLAQLVVEGALTLNTRLAEVLPLAALIKHPLTFLHLANHSSGLPRLPDNFYEVPNFDEKDPYRAFDEAALLSYLVEHFSLATPPGTAFAYSNLGFGLLSYLLGKHTGQAFTDLVQQRIFDPLQMRHSSFDPTQLTAQLVRGLDENGDPAGHWSGGALKGALGILSTVEDMVKFAQASFENDNAAWQLQLQPTIKIKDNQHMGLGFGLRFDAEGNFSYNHGGGSAGFTSFLKIDRQQQSGIVLLSTVSPFHPQISLFEDFAFELLAQVKGN